MRWDFMQRAPAIELASDNTVLWSSVLACLFLLPFSVHATLAGWMDRRNVPRVLCASTW